MKKLNNTLIGLIVVSSTISQALAQCEMYPVLFRPTGSFCDATIGLDIMYYGTQDFYVIWGDGSIDTASSDIAFTHTYNGPGIYYPYILTSCGDTIYPYESICGPGAIDSITVCDTIPYVQVFDSCGVVSGYAFIDINGNCIHDSTDVSLSYKPIIIRDINGNEVAFGGYTNSDGFFHISFPATDSFLVTIENVDSNLIPSCGTENGAWLQSGDFYTYVFGCSGSGHDLSLDIHTSFVSPIAQAFSGFWAYNTSCDTVTATITLNYPATLNLTGNNAFFLDQTQISPSISVVGNTVTITGITLEPYSTLLGYIGVIADSTSTIGDTFCINGVINPTTGDLFPTNNYDTTCGIIVTSYDPNDKRVFINGRPAEGYIDNNQLMSYTIRFQNEGSYYARRVRIVDTISNNLDISTLQIVATSHNMDLVIRDNEVTFIFDEIWLSPKDSNEALSHGFVSYTVSQKENLPIGTTIPNTAHIYFDYNPAITTNTVISIIGPEGTTTSTQQITEDINIEVYPNPASSFLKINNPYGEPMQVIMYTLSGQVMLYKHLSSSELLDLTTIPSGLYILSIKGENFEQQLRIMISKE